nr:hypothetical protein [Tanacetum cinerariifolium]
MVQPTNVSLAQAIAQRSPQSDCCCSQGKLASADNERIAECKAGERLYFGGPLTLHSDIDFAFRKVLDGGRLVPFPDSDVAFVYSPTDVSLAQAVAQRLPQSDCCCSQDIGCDDHVVLPQIVEGWQSATCCNILSRILNTAYSFPWMRRIMFLNQYSVSMDDPNITMEVYIRLEEEKSHRNGKVYNWETAMYVTPSYEPTTSPLNDNKIEFRISFDESDDEDYTVIYDEKSFSYKIIYVNNLKTDSENDNDKVNMPSFLSPEPEVSYSNDLDFFKDFEKEFPAIIYNNALMSISDFSTEPTLCPQHIDEFNLKNETSLFECDEKEQNILYFNDIFPFNLIYHDNLKLDTDSDNDKIDIEHSSGNNKAYPKSLASWQGSHTPIVLAAVVRICKSLALVKQPHTDYGCNRRGNLAPHGGNSNRATTSTDEPTDDIASSSDHIRIGLLQLLKS